MPISSAGVGSGLDVNGIVSQLVAIERRPITLLKDEATRLETQISAFGRLSSTLSTLRDAAAKLATPSTWQQSKGSSSSDETVGVATNGAVQAGSFRVGVTQLATGQTLNSARFASPSAALGSGTLRIELGNFDALPPVPKADAAAINIIIDPAATSLSQVRDRINAAGAGVVASIVNDIGGSRLVLRSANSGLENGFRVQVLNDADGDDSNATGLSALAFDPSAGGVSSLQRAQVAQNALATVDGVAIESASNTITGSIQGMTLQLRKVGQADVRVEPDTEALKKSVDEFVNAFNESVKLLRSQLNYDPTTKVAGALQGESAGRNLQAQLRQQVNGEGGTSSMYRRLSDIGITLNTDGTLKVDDVKVKSALANGTELQKLFEGGPSTGPESARGVGSRIRTWLADTLDNDGLVNTRTESLRGRVRSNKDQQDRLEDRVQLTQDRLLRQYQALDTRMGQLSGLSSYVTQQMNLLNNSSSRR